MPAVMDFDGGKPMRQRRSPEETPTGATEPRLGEARLLVRSAVSIRDRLTREGVMLSADEAKKLRAATDALWQRADELDAVLAGILSDRRGLSRALTPED